MKIFQKKRKNVYQNKYIMKNLKGYDELDNKNSQFRYTLPKVPLLKSDKNINLALDIEKITFEKYPHRIANPLSANKFSLRDRFSFKLFKNEKLLKTFKKEVKLSKITPSKAREILSTCSTENTLEDNNFSKQSLQHEMNVLSKTSRNQFLNDLIPYDMSQYSKPHISQSSMKSKNESYRNPSNIQKNSQQTIDLFERGSKHHSIIKHKLDLKGPKTLSKETYYTQMATSKSTSMSVHDFSGKLDNQPKGPRIIPPMRKLEIKALIN